MQAFNLPGRHCLSAHLAEPQSRFKHVRQFQLHPQQAPEYPEVSFYLGLSYLGLNEFEKAIDGFDRELGANPKYQKAHYYAAVAYQSLGRNTDALRRCIPASYVRLSSLTLEIGHFSGLSPGRGVTYPAMCAEAGPHTRFARGTP